jgi:Cytochrome P460
MSTRVFKFIITQSYVRCATALLLMLATAMSALTSMNADGRASVIYPEEYRTWFHVKSALVSADYPDFEHSGGFRHIYANPQAVVGYSSGIFPDGSIIVVDWLEAKHENGEFTEASRRSIDVMMKDRARFAATGGWGFGRFIGGRRIERTVTSAARRCFQCHAGPGTRDLVFSRVRE